MPTFDTPGPITVALELGIADVRLDLSERRNTVVDVRPTHEANPTDVKAAERTTIGFANGTLAIKSSKGWRRWAVRGSNGSIEVRIDAPAGSAIHGETGVADLVVSGPLGEVRYRAGVGDVGLAHTGRAEITCGMGAITVETIDGRADIKTAGAIRIGSIDGPAVIRNANGDSRVGEIHGDARLHASNGAIVVDLARASVVAKSANGAIRIGEVARGRVVAQTAMGPIEIGIADGVPAWLDLSTKFGAVRNDLERTGPPTDDDEAVEVQASTSMGDITIRRPLATGGRDR
jgi:DUF4097 and DUF4098 domain-containing protein YvlB